MAITRDEEIKQLEAQADTLQRRLWVLEQQIAGYGSLAVPTHQVLEREEAQRALDDLRDRLKRLREAPITTDAPYVGLLTFQEDDADRFFGDTIARVWVVEPRLLAAELTERVCRVFSDAEIGKTISSWRGCVVELAAVDADLKQYNSIWHQR